MGQARQRKLRGEYPVTPPRRRDESATEYIERVREGKRRARQAKKDAAKRPQQSLIVLPGEMQAAPPPAPASQGDGLVQTKSGLVVPESALRRG